MTTTKVVKAKTVRAEVKKTSEDVGSAGVQITAVTKRIGELTEHLKMHVKDHHSRRGLLQLVGKRKRLMTYLKNNDFSLYKKIIGELNWRG